jgi:hypothetical protein
VNSKQDFLYRFEHTWPAMSYKLNGTVFVYNPEDKKHTEELNLWYIECFSLCNYSFFVRYNNFVEKPNLSEKCCLLVAAKKSQDEEGGRTSGHEARLCKIFSLLLTSSKFIFV